MLFKCAFRANDGIKTTENMEKITKLLNSKSKEDNEIGLELLYSLHSRHYTNLLISGIKEDKNE